MVAITVTLVHENNFKQFVGYHPTRASGQALADQMAELKRTWEKMKPDQSKVVVSLEEPAGRGSK